MKGSMSRPIGLLVVLSFAILVTIWPGSEAFADCCSDPSSCVCSAGSLPLKNGGGPVIVNPQVFVVYWQMGKPPKPKDPGKAIPVIEGYLRGIGGTQWHPTALTLSNPGVVAMGDQRLFVVAKGSNGQFYAQLIDTGTGSWVSIGVGASAPIGRADVGAY